MIQEKSEISNQIASIQNLRMVNYYELGGDNGPVEGIMAYYEDRIINLSSADEHFHELFDKIVRVYREESQTYWIVADELTKKVLGKAKLESAKDYDSRLVEFDEVSNPIFLSKAFSHHVVLPIARFVIEKLYGEDVEALSFQGIENNWFGKGVMFGICNGESKHFPYQIRQEDDDTYYVMVSNVLRPGNLFHMEINIDKDGFASTFQDEYFNYEGSIFLRVTQERAKLILNVEERGKTIAAIETECECIPGEVPGKTAAILALGATAKVEAESWRTFVLPWGDKVYQSIGGKYDAQILTVERSDVTVSRGFVARNIGDREGKGFPYGCFAFELYERPDESEVHLLDMTYPRSALYQEEYVGKIYRKIK